MILSDRARRLALPIAAFLAGIGMLGLALLLTFAPSGRAPTSAIGGPIALVDQDGRPVTEASFAGRPHLVFFGFTHCPDVCPTTLFRITEILKAAGESGRDLRAVFITVDPERDTPAVLKEYLASFDPRIVALTGERPAVDAAIGAYRAFARKVPTKDGDYTMEHTAIVYLMDADNRFVGSFDLNRPPEEAAREWLRQS
jgi:protein SCO1